MRGGDVGGRLCSSESSSVPCPALNGLPYVYRQCMDSVKAPLIPPAPVHAA